MLTELGYFRLLLFVVSTVIQSQDIYIIYILLKLHNQCTKNRGALLRQVVGWVFSDFVVFFPVCIPGRGRGAMPSTRCISCLHQNV